jgi:hypothetical protein
MVNADNISQHLSLICLKSNVFRSSLLTAAPPPLRTVRISAASSGVINIRALIGNPNGNKLFGAKIPNSQNGNDSA